MAKNFIVQFGSGNPTTYTGLKPTFLVFAIPPSGSTTPPGITEIPSATGLYWFQWDLSGGTSPIAFTIDGATTGLQTAARYVSGALDPVQAVDEKVGRVTDSFGNTLTDPSTVLGFLKRSMEFNEGDSVFTKSSGQWQIWTRGNTSTLGATTSAGTSAMLTTKTLVDNGSIVSKT